MSIWVGLGTGLGLDFVKKRIKKHCHKPSKLYDSFKRTNIVFFGLCVILNVLGSIASEIYTY